MVFLSGRFFVITIVIDLFCPCGALRPVGMAKAPVVNTLLKRHHWLLTKLRLKAPSEVPRPGPLQVS